MKTRVKKVYDVVTSERRRHEVTATTVTVRGDLVTFKDENGLVALFTKPISCGFLRWAEPTAELNGGGK